MIRIKITKLLALCLALAMAFSMSACQTAAPTAVSTATPAPSQAATAAPTPSQTVEPTATPVPVDYAWEKYDTPVTITTAQRTTSGVTQLDNDTWDNNVWTREIESRFNIVVKNLWSADQSQYVTKLNVSIASGDLPDFYQVTNSQFSSVVNSGLSYDLTDIYNKYASADIKNMMAADKAGYDSGVIGGKLMGLGMSHYTPISLTNVIWIRDDWMKKFNFSAPKTLDDLAKILEAFTAQDPDGNGKNDTYGLAISKNLYDTATSQTGLGLVDGIFNAYHAYPGIWIKDASGKIAYGSVQPEMKLGLAFLQDMYKKGVISQEFGLMDSAKIDEAMTAGKVGAEEGGSWNAFYPNPDVMKKNGNAAILMPYAMPSADSQPIKLGSQWSIQMYYVVNKNCKNPEAMLKIMNLYTDIESNSAPDVYTKFTDGARGWDCPAGINGSDETVLAQLTDAFKTNDSSKLTGGALGMYADAMKWVNSQNVDSSGRWLQMLYAYPILKGFEDSGNVMLTEYRGVDTPTMTAKNATLETMEREMVTKVIMGASLDEFDKFVASWKALGGDAMTQELNDAAGK